MKRFEFHALVVTLVSLLLTGAMTGCSILYPQDEQREEMVGGTLIPIPGGMNKSTERRVELSIPGIEGGTVTYQGAGDPKEIISFYQIEMPRRGWTPKGSLVSQGGALAFTKETRSVLIRVNSSAGGNIFTGGLTVLDILVGAVPFQTSIPLQDKTSELPK